MADFYNDTDDIFQPEEKKFLGQPTSAAAAAGASEDAGFTVVLQPRGVFNQENSLYKYLQVNNAAIVSSGINLIFIEQPKQYILIPIANTDVMITNTASIQHTLLEQHLRVDFYYNALARQSNSFNYAHITMRTSDSNGRCWKHHVCFNEYGNIVNSEHIAYKDQAAREVDAAVGLDAFSIQMIKNVAVLSKDLLEDLIKRKDLAYQQAVEKFNSYETDIAQKVAQYLNAPALELWQEILVIKDKLLNELNIINNFADHATDMRGSILNDMLTKLASRMQAKSSQAAESRSEPGTTKPASEETEISFVGEQNKGARTEEDPEYIEITKLLAEFSPYLDKTVAGLSREELNKAHLLANELQLQILYCTLVFELTAAQQSRFAGLKPGLARFLDIKEVFINAVARHDLNTIQALYPNVKHKLNFQFYMDYLFKLIDTRTPKLEICQFFYAEKDGLYLQALRALNTAVTSFNWTTDYMQSKIHDLPLYAETTKLLIMFLDHGFDPNHTLWNYKSVRAPLLLHAIQLLVVKNHAYTKDLILKIILKGARVEYNREYLTRPLRTCTLDKNAPDYMGKPFGMRKKDKKQHSAKLLSWMENLQQRANYIVEVNYAMEYLIDMVTIPDPSILAALLPGTSLIGVAQTLVRLALCGKNSIDVNSIDVKRLYNSFGKGVYVAKDEHNADMIAKDCLATEFRSTQARDYLCVGILQIYCGTPNTPPTLIDTLTLLVNDFKSKCAEHIKNWSILTNIMEILFSEAVDYHASLDIVLTSSDKSKAKKYFDAALEKYEMILLFYSMKSALTSAGTKNVEIVLSQLETLCNSYAASHDSLSQKLKTIYRQHASAYRKEAAQVSRYMLEETELLRMPVRVFQKLPGFTPLFQQRAPRGLGTAMPTEEKGLSIQASTCAASGANSSVPASAEAASASSAVAAPPVAAAGADIVVTTSNKKKKKKKKKNKHKPAV